MRGKEQTTEEKEREKKEIIKLTGAVSRYVCIPKCCSFMVRF